MTPRFLVAFLLFVATATAPARELYGHELKEFSGPVPSTLITWHKDVMPGAESYVGRANPPLTGDINIRIFSESWRVDLGQQPTVGGPDLLGALVGNWSKSERKGVHSRGFSFADAKDRWMLIDINSPVEADVETLAREISRLPMFNARSSALFNGIIMRGVIAQIISWFIFPLFFLIIIALSYRRLRKREAGLLRQASVLGAISAVWIPLDLGLYWSINAMSMKGWPFPEVMDIIYSELAEGSGQAARFNLALAIAGFFAGLVIVVSLLLRRFFYSRFETSG